MYEVLTRSSMPSTDSFPSEGAVCVQYAMTGPFQGKQVEIWILTCFSLIRTQSLIPGHGNSQLKPSFRITCHAMASRTSVAQSQNYPWTRRYLAILVRPVLTKKQEQIGERVS